MRSRPERADFGGIVDYWDLTGFGSLYLEDSWVLDVRVTPGSILMECDLVLRPENLLYREPAPGEQYCYRRARICFTSVVSIDWREHPAENTVARDATGQRDYGSFDSFTATPPEYHLSGDFGVMDIVATERPFVDYT